MNKEATTIVVIAFVFVTAIAFLAGRATKECPVPPDRQPTIDSLALAVHDMRQLADGYRAQADTLSAALARTQAARPSVKTQVSNAYNALHVPVDSLASVLLASPDTAR
jgi:hypothetical protein